MVQPSCGSSPHHWLGVTRSVRHLRWVHSFSAFTTLCPTRGRIVELTPGLTEWKGRSDGLIAHIFFQSNLNFALSNFAFAVEGWIFYSAVNSIVPLIVLNLGFADDAWAISIRQLVPCPFSYVTLYSGVR